MPTETSERPRIYLDKVHLKGFKSIEDLSIDFQKGLNILIGKNGSGKSNFMEFLNDAISINRSDKVSFNYVKLDYISDDHHSLVMELEKQATLKIGTNNFNYRNELLEKLFIDGETAFDNSSDEFSLKTIDFKDKKIRLIGIVGIGGNLTALFNHWGYKYWHPLYIKFESPNNLAYIITAGTIKVNFENISGPFEYDETLSFMEYPLRRFESLSSEDIVKITDITKNHVLTHLKIQDKIIKNLQLYTPIEDARFNENINLYKDYKSVIIDNVKLEFKVNGNWLPWSQLSDGTKRLFYIIAEVTYADGLVLLEEPELGIHPHQFNLLMKFLKEQAEDKQIIISTHAPKALDRLSPNELNNILVTYYDLKKGTQMRHLKSKEIKTAKRYMNEVGFLSDYWLLSDLEE